jgi:hypothetical protein
MMLSLSSLPGQVVASLRDPRGFARRLVESQLPRQARWDLLALCVIAGTILTQLNVYLAILGAPPSAAEDSMQMVMERLILQRPIIHALLQFGVLFVTVYMIYYVGRAAGGRGSFEASILLVAWIELTMATLRVGQALVWLVSPALAAFVGVLTLIAFLWLLTQFVTELHGFQSPYWVFLGILGTGFAVLFGLTMILGLLGLSLGVA